MLQVEMPYTMPYLYGLIAPIYGYVVNCVVTKQISGYETYTTCLLGKVNLM